MERFRSVPWWLARPCDSRRYLLYCRAFALGSAVHLTLPDALQPSWITADVVYWLGVVLLAIGGSFAGWALCAVGLAVPLLWLEDQLTQSAYLLACATAALSCFATAARRRQRHLERDLPAVVRVLTVGVYLTAAFHKLNRDFFDPEVSCATGGVSILAENWSLPGLATPILADAWPVSFLCAELALAALLVLRPGAALVLGLAIHLPLTIVFAPAFAYTMIPGWLACLAERDIEHLERTLRRHWKPIVAAGALAALASLGLYLREHEIFYPYWFLKEAALWVALVWTLVAWLVRRNGAFGWWSAWREAPSRRGWMTATVFAALWLANGMTPYLGLQYHHAGAMLSNLRVDRGCWNHLLVPQSWQLRDPYVRIERVEVGGQVLGPDVLESTIGARLWSTRALHRARDRWCAAGAGPLKLEANHDGAHIEVDDLCTRWPFSEPILPGMRAFQVNLDPECPQHCIH